MAISENISAGEAPDTLRVFGTVSDSIVDGPGLRFSVFVQGCTHACPGCHNPESWDPAGGTVETLDDLEARIAANALDAGVTISGGEPFNQAPACAELARRVKSLGRNVWVYSGYLFEDLAKRAQNPDNPQDAAAVRTLLECADVLVDGPFVKEKRSLALQYCGSSNQRLVDLGAMRKAAQAAGAEWLDGPVKIWKKTFELPKRPQSW